MPRPKSKYIFGGRESKISIHSVQFYLGIIIALLLALLFAIVYFIDGSLPTPLDVKDEPNNPQSFIAERAAWDLSNLTSIGPRVVGSSENEAIAVDYLQNRIKSLMQEAHPNQFIELDLQITSGAYYLNANKGIINTYDKVQNIAVKLSGRDGTYSVLVNSHFDSVPTSPGASDDGINVAAMLEILRIISKEAERPLHNIVFLFNGAEETPLHASHGFITQHKWAKECQVIINLDACGSGGKIILFQTGPNHPWLVKYYSGVPHPYGQVAGEELFQTGLLPSDTDYRIFRDYGRLVGLDMAFIKNGYRYHTKHDRFSLIPLGSYQHVGDNTLYLVRSLANAPEISQQPMPSEGKAVYYDVFGWFFINYTNFSGQIVNVVTITLSLIVFVYSLFSFKLAFSKPTLKFLPIATGAILGSWILSALFAFVLAVILDLVGRTMSWFSHPWLIFGLYVVPTLGLSGILLFLTNHENISLSIRCQIQAHLVRLILTVILAFGVAFNIRATYALMIPILFSSASFVVIHATCLHRSVKYWQIVYIFFLVLPSMNLMYQALITCSLFIPMTGFLGSDKNPDIIIGLMAALFTLLIVCPFTALVNSLRNAKYFFAFLGCIFAISLLLILSPVGFPYSSKDDNPTTQRQWIWHTSRKFFNESGDLVKADGGFFFLNLDRNSPRALKGYVKELSRATPLSEDCENYAGCGVPLSHYRMLEIVKYGTWIPAEQPVLPEPLNVDYVSENISSTEINYNVTITGSDRLTLYIIPKEGVTIQNISLVNKVYPSVITFQGRPMYFINNQRGNGELKFSFGFNVRTPINWKGPTVNFTVVGRYVHPKQMKKTPEFLELLEQMPEWTVVTACLATNYVYQI